ncbi:MAG: tRNA(Ile)(2)-agmatinylcytidine synthase [Candidatus Bathyarchaeia archaeon]
MDVTLHIGIDDTDSLHGGCTTYVAAVLIERLTKLNVEFQDYPALIRLNPNIPWKTRGNGAVAIRLKTKVEQMDKIKYEVLHTVETLSQHDADPAVVFLSGTIPNKIKMFSKMALYDFLNVDCALKVAGKCGVEVYASKSLKGIIGALAAVGETLQDDYTYELLAYRTDDYRGMPRMVSAESVFLMDRVTSPMTFNNLDFETGRILITPRGPDPVLYGIRGEDPTVLVKAMKIVDVYEPIERWVIFRTNQGTDAHLKWVENPRDVKPYRAVAFKGVVCEKPHVVPGGHVIFKIAFKDRFFDCAAYEPTGSFREAVKKLIPGDVVEIYGGVRPLNGTMTINLEKIRIVSLARDVKYFNPKCPKCNSTMKSMGRAKGFKCEKCGLRDSNMHKLEVETPREIKPGLYIPPPRAQRHLTKPPSRYGLEKKDVKYKLIESWHIP